MTEKNEKSMQDSLKRLAITRMIAEILADQCGYKIDRAELDCLYDVLASKIEAGKDIYKKGGAKL